MRGSVHLLFSLQTMACLKFGRKGTLAPEAVEDCDTESLV